MEHLALEIFDLTGTGSKFAFLPEDASITITDTSEIFASGDVWSFSFSLNVFANTHIFGTSGDIHGSRLHEQLHNRKMRLWVEGMPLYLGYLKLDNEADVDKNGDVDVTFESGHKTFEEMTEGAKANQVPMIGDVQIGMALWTKRWFKQYVRLDLHATAAYGIVNTGASGRVKSDDLDWQLFQSEGEDDDNSVQAYPRYVVSKGEFLNQIGEHDTINSSFLNTDQPYDEDENGNPQHPYCNVALCYQKYDYKKTDENGNETAPNYADEPEAQRDYEYMPTNRVNSAPCFFVLYWLRALMKHLGIHIEENQMMDVEDLRRLFFVNTNCAYEEPKKIRTVENTRYGRYTWQGGGRIVPESMDNKRDIEQKECSFKASNVTSSDSRFTFSRVFAKVSDVRSWKETPELEMEYISNNSYFHKAFAAKECFPDADISEVIGAIENGFGVRFLFSEDFQRVRIILLRNIFCSRDVQELVCEIGEAVKKENNIRGFRMTYGDNDDTHFFYKGFDDMLPKKKPYFIDDSDKHDYSHWDLNANYSDLIQRPSGFDKTCYVTPDTGNAYGIKIDEEAKRYRELRPSVFEFAGFMDAEDGDCTGEDETIHSISMGFNPAIMNDLNMQKEREEKVQDQKFALFVEETMRVRRPNLNDLPNNSQPGVTSYDDTNAEYDVAKLFEMHSDKMVDGAVAPGSFAIKSDTHASKNNLSATVQIAMGGPRVDRVDLTFDLDGYLNEGYRLYLQDNYEPNDEGVSPIEKHDWGLTLGIMRGSGGDAYIDYQADPDETESNMTWDFVQGSKATMHPDICDCYGNEWDYNGSQEGIGSRDGRISLKLRAEKPNPYFNPKLPETHYDPDHPELNTNPRYLHITNPNLQGRGLCDQFYKEYSYWLRNARIIEIPVRMTLAQLRQIDKTKQVKVGDVTGFIRKIEYQVSNKTGLGEAKLEVMYI